MEMISITGMVELLLESELLCFTLMLGFLSLLSLTLCNLSVRLSLWLFLFARGMANLVAVRASLVGRSLTFLFNVIFSNTSSDMRLLVLGRLSDPPSAALCWKHLLSHVVLGSSRDAVVAA
jgi:hypothetical protein